MEEPIFQISLRCDKWNVDVEKAANEVTEDKYVIEGAKQMFAFNTAPFNDKDISKDSFQ